MTLAARLRAAAPSWLRHAWYMTDAGYRRQTLALRRLRRLRQRAMPAIWKQTAGVVTTGPFRGMRYLRSWRGHPFPQKLLGTYEKELEPAIHAICARGYDTAIVIGAGEGYYACGLALRLPTVRVTAFEAVDELHAAIRDIAAANGLTGRIDVRGRCTPADLRDALADGGLVVCDVEGFEGELLDPDRLPALRRTDVLVEVHDAIEPGVSQALSDRFQATHVVEPIAQQPRTLADLPAGIVLEPTLALAAMSEGRGAATTNWLWMRRR